MECVQCVKETFLNEKKIEIKGRKRGIYRENQGIIYGWILRYKAMVGALYKLIYYNNNNIIIYVSHNM